MEKKQRAGKTVPVLGFIYRQSTGQRRWLVFAVLGTLVSIAATYLMPQVIRFAVDGLLGGDASGLPSFMATLMQPLLAGGAGQALLYSAAAVVGLALLSGIFNFITRICLSTGTERMCRGLRNSLFAHIQRLPFKWHVSHQTGDIIQRCTSDLDVVRNFVSQQLLEVVRTVILVVVALTLMYSMNVPLAIIATAFIPLIASYTIVFYRKVGANFLQADEAEGELTVAVQENLTGVRVVRAFGRERYELDRFDGRMNRFVALWLKMGRILSVYWAVGDLATGLQIFTVIVAGAFLAADGQLTLGEFLVFVSYNQTVAWPIRSLGRVLSEMSKTGVSAARLQEILDAEEEQPEPAAQKPNLRQDITFDNVTFAYDRQRVLQDLSFTIPAGSTFGILGATGSGKSTITYLLNRLYDLPEGFGAIRIGPVNVRDIDREYLRRNVGLVLQEPFLYSRTIAENIAIAAGEDTGERQRVDFERVRHAASIAAVDESIGEFTQGYETMVGERGVTLSGGQKQRVAIARTLMLNAPVMVFDDSMSAVDLETDAKIRAALREGTGQSTVILISHRINTLMAADNILVLEDGRVADLGTHAELIRRDGTYKRIYDMQSEAAADAGERLEDLGALPKEGGDTDV